VAAPAAGAGPSPRSFRVSQGIVWGTNTALTASDERLCNRFDYDGEYGTVLNRFLMQAASGIPLTVYGTGGQTRAFIHISDTCRCIELAVANPPAVGERVEILNQVAETARVRDIAQMVAKLFDAEATPACSSRPPPPTHTQPAALSGPAWAPAPAQAGA
jgi:nucleoside-diphosphate-sugar epimerase